MWGGEVTIDTTRENAFFVSVIVVGLSKLCFTSVDYFLCDRHCSECFKWLSFRSLTNSIASLGCRSNGKAQRKGVRDARPVWKVGLEGHLESDCRQPRVPGTSP